MTRFPAGAQTPPILIDPFFDGGVQSPPAGASPTAAEATTPDLAAYHDASRVTLQDGRPITAVMRPGPGHLNGTVIPHGTIGGVPLGSRIHRTADWVVQVDPHIQGQQSAVRLGDITADTVARASQLAQQQTPEPTSIETLRLRSAAILHNIAAAANTAATYPEYAASPRQPAVGGVAAPSVQQYTQSPSPLSHYGDAPAPQQLSAQPRYISTSPLQAFRQADVQERELRAIDFSQSPARSPGVAPPRCRVCFEIEQFGTHTARYHDVVTENGFLVLIYDNRYTDGDPYFPPTAPDAGAPAMALTVEGSDKVHLVHTTGIQYSYGGCTHCVLLIERTAPMTSSPASTAQPHATPMSLQEGIDYGEAS